MCLIKNGNKRGGKMNFSKFTRQGRFDRLFTENEPIEEFENILKFINDTVKYLSNSEDAENDELLICFRKINDWESFVLNIPNFMTGFNSLEFRQEEAYGIFSDWISPKEELFQQEESIKKPTFADATENESIDEYRKQCDKILEDFLRPTNIRDVYYNIYGKVNEAGDSPCGYFMETEG